MQKAPLRPLTESGRTQAILDKSAQEVESVAKKRRILKAQRQTERQKVQRLKAELQAWDTSRRIRIYSGGFALAGSTGVYSLISKAPTKAN